TWLMSALFSMLPISELRGAIPYATIRGVDLLPAALWCIAWNALVPILAYIFLGTLNKVFLRIGWYRSFFERTVDKARVKVHAKVEKYGYWGLLVFVAIPLPMTGAWTGALGAWILGMERRKAILAIIGGVIVAGIIVTAVVGIVGAGASSIFIKQL
ncbi:MAG: small multi-drug export protein, partial [Rectinema sp.]